MKGEFDFITRHFRPLAGEESLDLRDDCALIPFASKFSGQEIAVSTDTMVENVHFLPSDPPYTLGKKLLRCNLSDLAAMGASPYAYTLNVTVPKLDKYNDAWFQDFSRGLKEDQSFYDIHLIGGDTTSTSGPLVLSATIFGTVPQGQALRRNTAQIGDSLWVTGTIGDAALGLLALQSKIPDPTGFLTQRYRLPEPKTTLKLNTIVNAAMDISDGLLQDSQHLSHESGVFISIWPHKVPRSQAARKLGNEWLELCLTGGDDYELLLACSPSNEKALQHECLEKNVQITKIGYMASGQGVRLLNEADQTIPFPKRLGWQHF
ncbi:thiamine-phosphate kinase [Swingsia samuiensis]|uniref:Thiamine-monophosphate kinase n=1 Tax=Swingsia samuiensis TaxID=1293412 RepID=A0A4Y6UPC7_9PROT|nr:thiamine-phosphate kinase [Swingsia samuiensis]QDH17905.1 thiamine-phosphate kinase [Swingsia samuiensis]